jgi:hypothetical protein
MYDDEDQDGAKRSRGIRSQLDTTHPDVMLRVLRGCVRLHAVPVDTLTGKEAHMTY